jgi:hypothetical protein
MHYVYGGIAGFVLGLVFHRYVLADVTAVKTHITNEFTKLRADLGLAVGNVAQKIK